MLVACVSLDYCIDYKFSLNLSKPQFSYLSADSDEVGLYVVGLLLGLNEIVNVKHLLTGHIVIAQCTL